MSQQLPYWVIQAHQNQTEKKQRDLAVGVRKVLTYLLPVLVGAWALDHVLVEAQIAFQGSITWLSSRLDNFSWLWTF